MYHDVPAAAGDQICEDSHDTVGSWVSFAITCGMLLIAAPCFIGAIPLIVQPKLQGDLQGGLAMLALGGIFAGIAAASFLVARHRSRSRVFLHENGVVLMRDSQLHFFPYEDCTQFTVEVYDPSKATVATAVVKAGLKALAGNPAGVGAALGATRARGYVAFQVKNHPHIILNGPPMSTLRIVAEHASRARGHDVIYYFD